MNTENKNTQPNNAKENQNKTSKPGRPPSAKKVTERAKNLNPISDNEVVVEKSEELEVESVDSEVKDVEMATAIEENGVETDEFDEIPLNARIKLKSIYYGKLAYVSSATKVKRVWRDYGSELTLSRQDVQTLHNEKPEFLTHPYILPLDKRVRDYYVLDDVCDNLERINGLETILNSGNLNLMRQKLTEFINLGMKDVLVSKIRKMRDDRTIADMDVIEIIKKELDLNLE